MAGWGFQNLTVSIHSWLVADQMSSVNPASFPSGYTAATPAIHIFFQLKPTKRIFKPSKDSQLPMLSLNLPPQLLRAPKKWPEAELRPVPHRGHQLYVHLGAHLHEGLEWRSSSGETCFFFKFFYYYYYYFVQSFCSYSLLFFWFSYSLWLLFFLLVPTARPLGICHICCSTNM